MRLLVVEDEPKLAEIVRRSAQRSGWSVDVVGDGTNAIWHGTEFDYDVIVLDVGIPEPDGFEVCRQLRENSVSTPILFLTARDDIADRVTGLDAGADDYLVKPFALDELAARLRALGRRQATERSVVLRTADLSVDVAARRVERGGQTIDLTPKEFAVLELLIRRKGEAVARAVFMEHAWDMNYEGDSNVVDVCMGALRSKVDRPFERSLISTVRGVGYRLEAVDQTG